MSSVSFHDFGYALDSNFALQALIDDPTVQIVINGHTHQPMVRHLSGLTIVNAGTIFRAHDPGYTIVDFQSGEVNWHGLTGDSEPRQLGSLASPPGASDL